MLQNNLIQPARQSIDLGERRIDCEIVFSKRKTVQLVLKSANLLIIKAPLNCDMGFLTQLVAKRHKWLLKHTAELAERPYAAKPRFEDGSTHFFMGQPYALSLQTASKSKFTRTPDRFLISVPNGDPKTAEKLLYKFYAKEAQSFFNQRLNALWPLFCVKLAELYPKDNWLKRPCPFIVVRRMKSRFGSMTVQNKMTLNTELIRTLPQYTDYVILHELCHLKHMHHGKAYYALLAQICPQWHKLKQELLRLLPLR